MSLKEQLQRDGRVSAPGVFDPFSARIAEAIKTLMLWVVKVYESYAYDDTAASMKSPRNSGVLFVEEDIPMVDVAETGGFSFLTLLHWSYKENS